MTAGWDASAAAWIAHLGEEGDPTRRDVLDAPMLAALPDSGTALDIGCGEGRFCRMMRDRALTPMGLDLSEPLIAKARERDPHGDYHVGTAHHLDWADNTFDACVFYLTLIDIPDYKQAITEAARVLKPGGTLLIANLQAHATAIPRNWPETESPRVMDGADIKYWVIDDMQTERGMWFSWNGIRIQNHHRPLSAYMQACLGAGLNLKDFRDPPYTGSDAALGDRYTRMPWAFMMVWAKPVPEDTA